MSSDVTFVVKGNSSQPYSIIPIGLPVKRQEAPPLSKAQKVLANYHARGELVRTWAVFDIKSEGGIGFNLFGDLLLHFPDDSILILTFKNELRLGSQMTLEMCAARYGNSPIY